MNIELVSNGWSAGTDDAGAVVVAAPDGRRWYPSLAVEVQAGQRADGWRWLIRVARLQGQRGVWGE